MTERTYTRKDMARAWEESRIATLHVENMRWAHPKDNIPAVPNPYEQEES